MSKRDEVVKKMFPETHASGLEAEYFFDDEENLPYEESHKDIIAYDGEFKYVNFGPTKLKELRARLDSGEVSIDPVALILAEDFMAKRCNSDIEAGLEPYRGIYPEARRVDKLSDCIGSFIVEHIVPCQLSDVEIENNRINQGVDLIDFDILTGENDEL